MTRWCLLLALLVAGCRSAGHTHDQEGAHAHAPAAPERPPLSFTHWTDKTELFLEFPALVQGQPSPCAAHVTRLVDFTALTEGVVTVVLQHQGAEERFEATSPTAPGIFRPVTRLGRAGLHRMRVEVRLGSEQVVHELGEVTVYGSVAEAAKALGDEAEPPGRITFLKEQQWGTAFGTEAVVERPIRTSVRATGTLRARDEGEAVIVAPSSGRITPAAGGWPRIGTRVKPEQTLALFAPRLEAADQASLELAAASAKLDVQHTQRERQRLEALRAEGAVPERRATEATHAEEEARVALKAAESRLSQFRQVQRPRGAAAGSIPLRALLDGIVSSVNVVPGTFVEAATPLFTIVDPSRLWLEAHVAAVDVFRLDEVRGAWIEVEGKDGVIELSPESLVGRSPQLDPTSRTLELLFAIDNAAAKLTVGTSARVHLVLGEAQRGPVIPVGALVDDGGQNVVFVQQEGESFERRPVRLGPREQGQVLVTAGLQPGERVVSRGAWSIKLAASSGAVPAHGHSH